MTGALCSAAAAVSLAVLVALPLAGKAEAHHGFDGRYDAGNPLWVEGTVREASYGFPHATMLLQVPEGVRVPEGLRGLPEVANVEGQRTLDDLSVLDRTGSVEILFPPPMTGEASSLPDRPEPGDTVGAIAYPECETGELRVQLLTFGDEVLVRQGSVQNEVRGCPEEQAQAGGQAQPSGGGQAQVDSQGSGGGAREELGPQETVARRVGGISSATVMGVAAAVAVVAAVGYVLLRSRRA